MDVSDTGIQWRVCQKFIGYLCYEGICDCRRKLGTLADHPRLHAGIKGILELNRQLPQSIHEVADQIVALVRCLEPEFRKCAKCDAALPDHCDDCLDLSVEL